MPLDSFDVSITPGEPAALLRAAEGTAEVRRWELRTVVLATGYLGALAVTGPGSRLVAWSIVPC